MKKKPAPKKPFATVLSVKEHGLAPILNAAYLLTDRAYAHIDGSPKTKLTVTLRAKNPKDAAGLGAEFQATLRTQELRWAQAEANRDLRERVARQGLLIAAGVEPAAPAPAPAPAQGGGEPLSAEQQAEIDRLIAEVEVEIKELKAKPAGADPENVRATWEEKHEEAGS